MSAGCALPSAAARQTHPAAAARSTDRIRSAASHSWAIRNHLVIWHLPGVARRVARDRHPQSLIATPPERPVGKAPPDGHSTSRNALIAIQPPCKQLAGVCAGPRRRFCGSIRTCGRQRSMRRSPTFTTTMEPVAPAGACATGFPRRDVARVEAEVSRRALVRVARIDFVAATVHGRTRLSSMPRCAHGRRPDCVTDAAQSPPARRHCEFPPLRATPAGEEAALQGESQSTSKAGSRIGRSSSSPFRRTSNGSCGHTLPVASSASDSAVTALAIGNSGKLRDAATGGHAVGGHAARRDATGDCCDSCDQPRSHDTSRR